MEIPFLLKIPTGISKSLVTKCSWITAKWQSRVSSVSQRVNFPLTNSFHFIHSFPSHLVQMPNDFNYNQAKWYISVLLSIIQIENIKIRTKSVTPSNIFENCSKTNTNNKSRKYFILILKISIFSPDSAVFDATIYRRVSFKHRSNVPPDDTAGAGSCRSRGPGYISREWKWLSNGTNPVGRCLHGGLQYYITEQFWLRDTISRRTEINAKRTFFVLGGQQSRLRPLKRGWYFEISIGIGIWENSKGLFMFSNCQTFILKTILLKLTATAARLKQRF